MVQRVEAWGNVLEFPDGMSDEDMATAIRKNEVHLNPDASTLTKAKSAVSNAVDAGLSMLTPKKSIADQAQERSASLASTAAPQVSGAPIRQDYYNKVVATPESANESPIVQRIRNADATDTKAQSARKTVAGALTSTEPAPEEGGFVNSAVRTVGQGIKGAGRLASDFAGADQNNAATQYGQSLIDANPTAVNSLEDIAAKPGTAVSEATGNAVPSMAGMVGARAVGQGITALAPFTGPAAPLVAAAGQVVSWLGPAAIAALPSYGGIRDKQILNDPANEKDAKAKVIALLGAGAVGAIEQSFGPQQWAMMALTKEGRASLAAKFAATTIPGAMAKAGLKGAGIEGAEELAQNPIEQLASYDDPTTKASLGDTAFGGAMGAISGGVLGGGAPMLAGKPVTEHSDAALRYTAARGGKRASEAAQAELNRRAVQGVDPEIANAPESTTETVDRIIATGREKADETRAATPDALESNVLDEENGSDNTPETSPEAPQRTQPEGASKPSSILPEAPTASNEQTPAASPQGGANVHIVLPDSTTLPAQWDVVDADSVKASLKEGVNQPRDRSRAASDIQVQGIANNPDYRRLSDSPVMDVGAPTLSNDGLIVGGNGRFEGINRAYDQGTSGNYLAQLKADAAAKGIDPAKIDNMKKPVLVRRITQPFDTRKLAEASNSGTGMQYSSLELAKIDAGRMKNLADLDVTDSGDITLTGANIQNVRHALSGYNAAELGAMVDKNGHLSQEGVKRIRNALLFSAYGSNPTLERLVESTDNDLRNISGALVKAAGTVARVRADIQAGSIPAELDISHDLVSSVEELSKIRAMGMTGEQYFAQLGMFGGGLSEEQKHILLTLEANIRSQKKLADFIKDYYEAVSSIDLSSGDMFGNSTPTKPELLKNAKDKITDKQPETQPERKPDAKPDSKPVDEGAKKPGNNESPDARRKQDKPAFDLKKQSEAELKAAAEKQEAEKKKAEAEKKRAEAEEKKKREQKEIDSRLAGSADNFELGKSAVDSLAGQGDIFSQPAGSKRLDHGELNIKGRTDNINRELDRYKKEQESLAKTKSKASAQQTKEQKALAKSLLALHGQEIVARHKAKFGEQEIKRTLDQWSKWEPHKLISFVDKFLQEKAASSAKETLDYDKIQTRPGTTEGQLKAGRSAYAQRLGNIVNRANGSLLGAALAKDFRERGGSELIGKTVKSPQDLAVLAQVFRDPRFETFRIFFTKQGKIVHHTGITSRLPGAVNVVVGKKGESPKEATERLFKDLAKQKDASGADGYYVLHNHPSARPTPSTADEHLTKVIANALPGFLSHVVINSNEYAIIDRNGKSKVIKKDLTGGYSKEASVPHDALRKKVNGSQALAEIGKQIDRKEGFFSVIGLSSQLDVVAIADIPLSIISERSNLRLHAMLRMFARNSGANAMAVVSDDLNPFKNAIRSGVIVDAISAKDGSSARIPGLHPDDNLYGKNPKSIRVDQTPSQYLFQTFNSPEKSRLDDLIHALQDKHIDLKRVTEAIKATGTQIVDSLNAYLQEELFHGRTATRVKEFIDKELDPLIKLMRVNGVKMADFEEYLWARHAEERNIQIAKINPAMPDGGSGMDTKDAQSYLVSLDPKKKALYEALAKRVDAINAKSRQVLVDYGLESQGTINTWQATYKHYVPLMREDMDQAFGNGTGQGFSIKGNAAKRATGSKRPVVDILANIAQQREKNIIRGEKNRVATALVGLAKTNPNPDFWKVDTPPTIRTVNKTTGLVEDNVDPNYKNRDNVVVARIPDRKGNIQERSVVFNERDERALRMAQSLKNLDVDQLNAILNASSAITRYFSSINTQYNPIFGIVNLARDVQGAMLNLTSTPLAGKKAAVIARTGPALAAIYQSMRGARKGKATNNQWSQLWEEFQKEGGKTGFRDMYANAKARADALEKGLNPDWWQTTKIGKVITAGGLLKAPERILADKAVKPLFDWLSDYNDSMENAVRLAAYKTALEQGLSKQQAASLAKNLTVNFNRKGSMGRQIGALYAFFNASVQGTARLAETVKGPAGKRIVAGGLLLGGMQAMLLAISGMGDDEPPEFVKSRSLILPIGDGKYLSVPMPLGFNVLPNMGRITTDFVMSGFNDPGKRTIQMMDSILDAFNPVGNAGMSLQTFLPTVADPFGALAENKDWTGKPIAREDFNSMNPTPGFTRAKDTASAFSKLLAEGLNELSGGTKYQPGALSPTPDQIDYLISQATGGVGREYLKAEQTVTAKLSGEELPPHKVPLLGRFYGDTKGSASQEAPFYEHIRRLNGIEAEIKGRMKNRENVDEFKQKHPEWKLIGTANTTEKLVQELRKRGRDLDKTDKPNKAELKKQFLERRREIMTRFNDKYKEATAN